MTFSPSEQASAARFDAWARSGRGVSMAEGHVPLVAYAFDRWRLTPEDRLLDVGCGVGSALVEAQRRGVLYLAGLDVSTAMIAVARERLPGGDLAVGTAAALPWGEGAFTHVLSVESVYYHDDPARSLAEMARVLVGGGRVGLAIELYGENPGAHGWVEAMDVPMKVWSTARWERTLARAGFIDVGSARIVREAPGRTRDTFEPSPFFASWEDYATYLAEGALWLEGIRAA